jgi:organic radical activating enzyme
MKHLKVTTIFYSIQGEATHIGKASIFIRLYGCNLECPFCDDLLHTEKYTHYAYEEILNQISKYPSKHIIITGGEPSIYDLNDFIEFLQKHNYYVSIETNGFNFCNISNADWITYSPKDWTQIDLTYADEFKFVVNRQTDIGPLLGLRTTKPMFIQPENGLHIPNMENIQHCINLVQQYSHFKLSVQMHKFLAIQ